MLWKWPIRVKLSVGLALLVLVVGILAGSGLYTMYAYRDLVKHLSWRVVELPVAAELSRQVGDLQVTLSKLHGLRKYAFSDPQGHESSVRLQRLREEFRVKLAQVEDTLSRYRVQLEHQFRADSPMGENLREWATVAKIEDALASVHRETPDEDWMLDELMVDQLGKELEDLQGLAAELPSHLHDKLAGFAGSQRSRYRALIVGAWITSITALLLFALFVRLAWQWILHPLRMLIRGSRRVAAGEFDYRIHLDAEDEMSELADALNDMTARFQDICNHLDAQVRERTKQVVRSEHLASVGFLAAGVAHEINNPLASIAMCAESLESRIREVIAPGQGDVAGGDVVADELAIINNYLQVVQKEAFRCKEITEKLLDFSRIGQTKRQHAELGELVQDMVEMIGHLGKYQQKHIELVRPRPVIAAVNAQEIKQIVLNLLTNALDSLADGGTVRIELSARDGFAELTFADNGCGMEPEVLEHVFEPFFTRRRVGQGTGLGLSITFRIVADHGGTIQAESPGPGRGATFRVRLPLGETDCETYEESDHQHQAA